MPRYRTWGSANTWSMARIGPHGTPAASRRSIHQALGCFVVSLLIAALRASRLAARRRPDDQRASCVHSVRPAASQKRANCAGEDAAIFTWPSAVANTPIGARVG